MYCRYCGKQIEDDSIYCSYCGKKLVTEKIVEILPTKVTVEDLKNAWTDDFGVKYSLDKKRLLKAPKGLETYNIPQGTVCLGDDAFFGCESLQQITIPDSVTSIGDYAFYNCADLQSITIPDSVTSVGLGAFWGCKRLKHINASEEWLKRHNELIRKLNEMAIISDYDENYNEPNYLEDTWDALTDGMYGDMPDGWGGDTDFLGY